ncbi:MAG: hypothetical protein KAH95_02905, partial [Spirochaetales bacterium]|nr:hypothetical protein [Spirochaetales bacterium]
MKNKIGFIIIILLLTISSFAWTSANFEISPDIKTLVPEDALMYFQIADPENLMSSTDSFLAATGMNEFIGNMKLQDFINVVLMSKNENLSSKYLNLSKPIGFAIIPGEDKYAEKKDVDFMLFLPINTSMNILDLIDSQPVGDDFWYTIFM